MLKIKELSVSKELDAKALSGVRGGMTFPFAGGFAFNFASPISAPKFANIAADASSYTGPVTSSTAQDDRDVITNVGFGQAVNTGGNVAYTDQWVTSFSQNFVASAQ